MRDSKQAVAGVPSVARLVVGVGVSLAALVACDGSIAGSNGQGAGGSGPGPFSGGGAGSSGGSVGLGPDAVGPRPLSRLSRREYNNTVRDLLGDATHPADDFPDDHDRAFLFRRAGLVATQDADLLRTTAEALATTAVKTPSSVLTCDASSGEDACAAKFIADFGKRAYRRPLSGAETMRLTALYQNARTTQMMSFNDAIETLLEAMLQSPAFLYHWESPYDAPKLNGSVVELAPYDVASRLSYFIWGSMPDQQLFDAAAAGKLSADADIATQARRMLADDKAKDAATAFFREWLEIDQIGALPKDAATYPDYNDALKTALVDGTEAFARDVMFASDGKLETLLTADYTFSNQTLGKVYGNNATGTTLSKTTLVASQRLGLLMEPSFLALAGSADGSNPVKRGKAVLTKVLCGDLPPPPPDVPPAKPATAGGTTRQRFTEHDQNACAKGCHLLMDPIGYAFEHYDGIGRYRTMDNGQAVDSTGMLNIDGADKSFADAIELTKILSTSATVRSCFSKQWFRFAVGRDETDADASSLTSIATAFATNQFDMRDLAPAIAASRSFRFRSLAAGEVTK
jgi:Protein of unknown function (DUF1592)/Protein of unknown function (DUF1588)/Protein of unknown function (DUF1595)/Protein of unknown function (DUF1585)/Protein of unknown function (DUF1587)